MSDNALKPYLELPHLISLAWLAYPILSLLFVAFRLQSSLDSSQDAIASAKDNLARSCLAAQKAATSTASMPRFMAVATNAQIEDAVNGTLNAARAALVLSLTVMETVINFIIDLYRSTFLCFLELVVRGGLSILISAVKEITDFIENTLSGLRTSIQNDVSSVNSAIQSAVDAINKVNPFADIKAPQFNIPSLDALANVTIPNDFENALVKLNASIPTVAEIKDKVESIIDTPFELVKKEINDTFANLTFSGSTLPVPKQNTVSFCGDLDMSVIDDLGADLIKTARIGVVVIVLLALLLFGANCFVEWFKWRCLKNHLQYTREAWTSDPTMAHARGAGSDNQNAPTMQMTDHNLMVLHNASAHPLITKLMNNCAALFRLSPTAHTRMQWLMSYVFHPPALACFLIGFFGILSVQIQLAAVGPLSERFNSRAEGAASDFSATIAASLNSSMYSQSAEYAADMNARINAIQSQLDGGVFGWINTTTVSLNTTLNNFYDDVQDVVTTVFGGTILEQPAQEFIRCIIGSKVDALESALTFLHDHIVVELPRVNDTILVLDPATVQEATRPIALAAIGDSSDNKGEGSGIVGKVIASYVRSLKKERIMFAIFLAIWFFVVLMGLGVLLWHARVAPYLERRKQRRWIERERAGVTHFADERGFTAGPVVRRSSSDTLSSPVDEEKVRLPYLDPLPPSKERHLSFSTAPNAIPTDEKRKTTRFHMPSIRRKPAPVEEAEEEQVQEREIPSEPTSRFSTPTPGTATAAWYKRLTSYLKKDNTSPVDVPPTPYTLTAPTKSWNDDHKSPSAYADADQVPTSPPVWERFRSVPPPADGPRDVAPGYDGLPAPLVPMPLHHAFATPPSPQTPPLQPPRVVVHSPTPTTPSDTMSSPVYFLSPERKTRRLSAQAQMRIALGGTMSPVSRYMESKKEGGNPFASPEDERARW